MQPSNDPKRDSSLPQNDKEEQEKNAKEDQQRSDPPLTEIKGVTEPEEYVEPEVEDEPEK